MCLECFDNINKTMTKRICGPPTPETRKMRPYTEGCGREFSYSAYFLKMFGFKVRVFCNKCTKDTTGKRSIKKLKSDLDVLKKEVPQIDVFIQEYIALKGLK